MDQCIYLEDGVSSHCQRPLLGQIRHFEDIQAPAIQPGHDLQAQENEFHTFHVE